MSVLGCSAHNCVNNEGGFCGASTILINGDEAYTSEHTFCENYEPETIVNAFKAIPNTNFFGEIAQILSNRESVKITPTVLCTAENCFYNGEGMCEASNLIIVEKNSNAQKTQCETFAPRH